MGFYAPQTFGQLLANGIHFLIWIVLIDVAINYLILFGVRVSRYHPFVRFVRSIASPILNPIRRLMPPPNRTGGWDLAPLAAILLMSLAERLLLGL